MLQQFAKPVIADILTTAYFHTEYHKFKNDASFICWRYLHDLYNSAIL